MTHEKVTRIISEPSGFWHFLWQIAMIVPCFITLRLLPQRKTEVEFGRQTSLMIKGIGSILSEWILTSLTFTLYKGVGFKSTTKLIRVEDRPWSSDFSARFFSSWVEAHPISPILRAMSHKGTKRYFRWTKIMSKSPRCSSKAGESRSMIHSDRTLLSKVWGATKVEATKKVQVEKQRISFEWTETHESQAVFLSLKCASGFRDKPLFRHFMYPILSTNRDRIRPAIETPQDCGCKNAISESTQKLLSPNFHDPGASDGSKKTAQIILSTCVSELPHCVTMRVILELVWRATEIRTFRFFNASEKRVQPTTVRIRGIRDAIYQAGATTTAIFSEVEASPQFSSNGGDDRKYN